MWGPLDTEWYINKRICPVPGQWLKSTLLFLIQVPLATGTWHSPQVGVSLKLASIFLCVMVPGRGAGAKATAAGVKGLFQVNLCLRETWRQIRFTSFQTKHQHAWINSLRDSMAKKKKLVPITLTNKMTSHAFSQTLGSMSFRSQTVIKQMI